MKRSLQYADKPLRPLFAVSGVALIAATYGLARLGYGLFLPAFAGSFALTPSTAGVLASGASILYCVAAGIGFRHAGSRPRTVTLLAGASAGLGSLGIAIAPTTAAFVAAVLVAGMGAGFASPALVMLVRRNARPSGQGRLQSVVNSGTGFGVIAAGGLSFVLGDAWRVAWVLIAAVAAASTLGVLRSDSGGTPPADAGDRPSFLDRTNYRGLSRPLVGAFVFGVGCSAVWVYGRTVLEEEGGMTVAASAGAWVALGLGGAGATLAARWLAARPTTTTWSVTVLCTAGATALVGTVHDAGPAAYAAMALFGLAYTAASSVLILWASAAARSSAAGTSVLFIALVLGQAVGAALTGILIDAVSPLAAFATAAAACALSAGVVLRFRTPTTAGRARPHGSR